MPEFFELEDYEDDKRFSCTITDRFKTTPPLFHRPKKRFEGILEDKQKGIIVRVEAESIEELRELLKESRRKES